MNINLRTYLTVILGLLLMIPWPSMYAACRSEQSGPLRIAILGPPGSGKGTLSAYVAEFYGLPVVTMSQVISNHTQEDTEQARQIKNKMKQGKLISDQEVWSMLQKELKLPLYKQGYILDGFPRTLAQAKLLASKGLTLYLVIRLNVDDQMIIDRMSGRRVHPSSGRVYHIQNKPPMKQGYDDVTGEPLIRREDDHPDTVTKRLALYHKLTQPMSAWLSQQYHSDSNAFVRDMVDVDSSQSPKQTWAELKSILQKKPVPAANCLHEALN